MILSVSRRTDIPAFYMEWFLNRLKEGWVLTKNPMNPSQAERLGIRPPEPEEIRKLTEGFSAAAGRTIRLVTCAESAGIRERQMKSQKTVR